MFTIRFQEKDCDKIKKLRSYSIGINRFRLVGLAELFRVLLTKNRLRLVSIGCSTFFNPHQTGLKWLKKHWKRPLLFSQALIAATCVIYCVISSIAALMMLLVNKRQICYNLIHLSMNSNSRFPFMLKKQGCQSFNFIL